MTNERVLVAYATKHGSTAEIANAIGARLHEVGLDADVRPARDVRDLAGFGAVVLGSAVYALRWQGEAVDFLKRHERELAGRPVWLFSSGPLDRSADDADLPMPKAIVGLAGRIGIRGHTTFGGRLAPDAKGFVERLIIRRGGAGDWRNFERIRGSAATIAEQLARTPITA